MLCVFLIYPKFIKINTKYLNFRCRIQVHLPVFEYLWVGVVLALEHVDVARLVGDARVVEEGLHCAGGLGDVAPVARDGRHARGVSLVGPVNHA